MSKRPPPLGFPPHPLKRRKEDGSDRALAKEGRPGEECATACQALEQDLRGGQALQDGGGEARGGQGRLGRLEAAEP
eukprot:10822303-Alexandrium_andersonii.AAC.1